MVKKVCFRHASGTKRHQVNFKLGNILHWRDSHPRLFNFWLALGVAVLIAATLVWQQPSIAKKLASTGLDDYFKQDVLADQKDDTDRDGLKDAQEVELKTDPNKPDTDGDGLLDGEEVNTYKTNPLASDTDGDKFSDATEVLTGHDPNRPNTPGDSTTSAKTDSKNSTGQSAATAEGLDSISQVLNGDSGSSQLKLEDMNLDNLSDISSVFGSGNTAEILVTDSDIKVVDVPENAAKEKIQQYLDEVGLLLEDVFKDEFTDLPGSQKNLEAIVSSGDFARLEPTAQKAQLFTDRMVQMGVPVQAKEFHKILLKTFLQGQALSKSMQEMQSDTLASLVVLDQVSTLEADLAEFQTILNQISTRYELGYLLSVPFKSNPTSATSLDE